MFLVAVQVLVVYTYLWPYVSFRIVRCQKKEQSLKQASL
jgi:hypothetical protein